MVKWGKSSFLLTDCIYIISNLKGNSIFYFSEIKCLKAHFSLVVFFYIFMHIQYISAFLNKHFIHQIKTLLKLHQCFQQHVNMLFP